MSKFSNMLLMIEYLKTGRKYNVKELSEKLEVSQRVVREYKLFLEEAGFTIDTIMGPYGGYVLKKDINNPILKISDKDYETLKKINLKLQNSDLDNIINKIKVNLLNEENKNTSIISNDDELKVYNSLSKAIKYNNKVRIKYYNLQHGESIRTIYPLGLYLFQDEWWCSSYWEEKDDMRQFHICRILDCEILSETFDPKKINIKF